MENYLGSQQHWEDNINADYDERERRAKEQTDDRVQPDPRDQENIPLDLQVIPKITEIIEKEIEKHVELNKHLDTDAWYYSQKFNEPFSDITIRALNTVKEKILSNFSD